MEITYPQRVAVIKVYMKYPQAADPIIQDPKLAVQFCSDVNAELESSEQFVVQQLNRVLHNLRKLGEARGGLPRKQRQFHGRSAQAN
ncbi:MAG: hypothetical protein WKF77_11135 [Planctomycetaceae bacterium]